MQGKEVKGSQKTPMIMLRNLSMVPKMLYNVNRYQDMVGRKQEEDLSQSFGNQSDSQWFFDGNEPTSKSGKNKGLTLILDAHTDIVETGTVSDDVRVS